MWKELHIKELCINVRTQDKHMYVLIHKTYLTKLFRKQVVPKTLDEIEMKLVILNLKLGICGTSQKNQYIFVVPLST